MPCPRLHCLIWLSLLIHGFDWFVNAATSFFWPTDRFSRALALPSGHSPSVYILCLCLFASWVLMSCSDQILLTNPHIQPQLIFAAHLLRFHVLFNAVSTSCKWSESQNLPRCVFTFCIRTKPWFRLTTGLDCGLWHFSHLLSGFTLNWKVWRSGTNQLGVKAPKI